MGSSTSTQNTQQSTTPWAPQAGALTNAFTDAQNAYSKASQAQAPTNFVAQFTPDQLNTFYSMLGYAGNNNNPAMASNTGAALQGAGANAEVGALSGLSNYNPTTLNNPAAISAAAKTYADNQNIGAETAAATNQAMEQARDVTMPGIEQGAAMTGNTNSSRTGIADGLVQRSLAENAANTYNSLYSQAYGNGLSLASSNANANNTDELGALSTAASAGTNAANAGVNAGSTSINDAGSLYNLAMTGGQGEQNADQANLTNQYDKYQSDVSSPYQGLSQLMSVIGSNNWGGNTTGTNTTTSTPSAWSVLGGLLGGAGSIANTAGGLGWKPFA